MNLTNLSSQQLIKAANIKDQIEALNNQLNALLGGTASIAATKASKKGGMSAAGRARIAAAQKARWAKIKGAKGAVKVAAKKVQPATPKRKISAAGLARIKAAAKARWARFKAGKAA